MSELEPPAECAALGAPACGFQSAGSTARDGRRQRPARAQAPGYLDERSVPFDAEIERAIRDGDTSALLAVDAVLARDLMATGRAAWQVLAGAMTGAWPGSRIRYCDDPFGVAYLVASLTVISSR